MIPFILKALDEWIFEYFIISIMQNARLWNNIFIFEFKR